MKLPYEIQYKYAKQWAAIGYVTSLVTVSIVQPEFHVFINSVICGTLIGVAIGVALEIFHIERRRNYKHREAKAKAKALRKVQRAR